MKFVEFTKLNLANESSTSLRTTVPKKVVEALELKRGDRVQWDVEITKNKKKVTITKITKKEE